tara:strand:+ start:835 stop:1446 length:612 start_codon:yes stop_codon:yes gene_type:complete
VPKPISLLDVPRGTMERLEHYVALLLKWQRSINLISNADATLIWERHIVDAHQLLPIVLGHRPSHIIDIGSGGGIPGIVLAILHDTPITLVESDRRKIAFLETVCAELNLFHVKLLCQRIEDVEIQKPDIITARGCASIDQMLQWIETIMCPTTICVFPKGKTYAMELEEAQHHWQFDYVAHVSETDTNARILELCNIHRRAS